MLRYSSHTPLGMSYSAKMGYKPLRNPETRFLAVSRVIAKGADVVQGQQPQ